MTRATASSFTDEIDGAVSDLLNVPGIGKATAAAMRASGELQSVADLRKVCTVGCGLASGSTRSPSLVDDRSTPTEDGCPPRRAYA